MRIHTLSLLLSSGLAFAAPTFPVLTYATYLRDSFTPKAIATDSSGNIYLAGNAIVDPATRQSTVLVVKLNPQGTQYLYVRYLGGSVKDSASAIAVDPAGNAYVAGATASPDFPVTSGGNLGTSPSPLSQRSFVFKLDPTGQLVFSDLLGGSAGSAAQAVAVTAAGRIVVSGIVSDVPGPAFPSTAGAYSISSTANHPYLLELDSTGTKVVFSATGIGGSALALDPSGNIYVAGSTFLLDYPTTPGAYQSTFPAFQICFSPPCSRSFQGANQYVTKVDPTGSTLIYSTAVSGNGNTTNAGVAVDAAGNIYLTGYAGPTYPYTVTPPPIPIGPVNSIFFFELPFLSKLDPAGKALLFSVPVGGAGVQVDSHGAVYVSGGAGSGLAGSFGIPTCPVPAQQRRHPQLCLCLRNRCRWHASRNPIHRWLRARDLRHRSLRFHCMDRRSHFPARFPSHAQRRHASEPWTSPTCGRLPRRCRFFATAASRRNAASLLHRRFGGSGAGGISGSFATPHDVWNWPRPGGCC